MKIPRKHILVVESETNSVVMLQLYLGHAKYRVTAANTCGECLQLARIKRVDLYLLGDGCEDGDTFELCRKIRALDSDTPIIICSADVSQSDRRQGMSAGAQAYLSRSPLDFARNNAETAMNRAFERLFVQKLLALYLAKPCELEELRRTISRLITGARGVVADAY